MDDDRANESNFRQQMSLLQQDGDFFQGNFDRIIKSEKNIFKFH